MSKRIWYLVNMRSTIRIQTKLQHMHQLHSYDDYAFMLVSSLQLTDWRSETVKMRTWHWIQPFRHNSTYIYSRQNKELVCECRIRGASDSAYNLSSSSNPNLPRVTWHGNPNDTSLPSNQNPTTLLPREMTFIRTQTKLFCAVSIRYSILFY